VRLAQEAASLGIQRIDLGKGPERYKQSLMSGADLVAEGSLDLRRVRGLARKTVHNARQLVRSSPLQRPIQRVVRGIRGFLKYR
jgi:CelD/BcsL family acetyltransferase involved in cellulose biosynthesis